jgi:predicted kinase
MKNPTLYIFSGLPGSGKSTLAKELSRTIGAVYIRIDTIEQALRDLCHCTVQGEGYRLAYRLIADNLRLGSSVVADSCNPIALTRREYETIAEKCACAYQNIEIICSDKTEHKHRVETRSGDIPNLNLPTWEEVESRAYDLWTEKHIVIDTARKSIENCLRELLCKR